MRDCAERIRVRGLVQGVGFRPTVWRLAQACGLRGSVSNDGQGVIIHVCGPKAAIDAFARALNQEAPPLARIEQILREPAEVLPRDAVFQIAASDRDSAEAKGHTGVVPDAATCTDCLEEVFDPRARRFRYPFTNCTHCGPRLSIIEAIPYDRESTTMRSFNMCADCSAEYGDPSDRRFHAQPIACHACGPRAWLERSDGADMAAASPEGLDALDAACDLLQLGRIVAIKGLGGFQLACNACDPTAVARLRRLKQRERKPFALMVRDLAVARQFASVDFDEEALLRSSAAPIVILAAAGTGRVAASVAPGVATLGLMLPHSPLHHLILQRMDNPIVLTSGNSSDEPQCIANDEARRRLGGIADYFLFHDREIARRVDDSVQRIVAGVPRMLRRARGHAPASLQLPTGFDAAPPTLAMGGELKNSFCLMRAGEAILSHHMGDLEDARTYADYRQAIGDYLSLFEHVPRVVAIDAHPEYLSAKIGRELAQEHGLALTEVQHHHAHAAACLAENGIALDHGPVLAVVLDGLGYGDDGTLWGGEFLLADYRHSRRLATFKPVAMPGGAQAIREPWRSAYAHLMAAMGWADFAERYGQLELCQYLRRKPRASLDSMIAAGVNSPLASSCGRLFDAVAAAAGLCREQALYEGQPAIEYEALVDLPTLKAESESLAYHFEIALPPAGAMPRIDASLMWMGMLGDLQSATPVAVIAARFHKGLAIAICAMISRLAAQESNGSRFTTVALSGGVFQNCVLLEQVVSRGRAAGLRVLTHCKVPAGDGGLALGQAVVAAARHIGVS